MTEITSRLSTALTGRYKIERRLGEGGMATVYLAEDLKHERKVALKVLKPELAAVLGAERFVQEIKTTANLQHPNILPLFDSGTAGGPDDGITDDSEHGRGMPRPFLYYVMPFIDGETLRDKLNRETQLGIEEAVKIATDVADALDYAHRNNVIHRDIKPENILLHDGRPMVADFGIALAVSAAAGGRMTETGLSLGTPHYMSPEQATAEKDLTYRSDIYSLGSVLYEMLTGSPPHVGSSAQQIIMKIVAEDVQPVAELRKSVPPHVAAAVAKSLEKLAADRFGTAQEFAEVLEGRRQIVVSTDAAISRPALPRRSAYPMAVGGAAVGALLATTVFLIVNRAAPERVERWTIASLPYVDTIPIDQVLDISPDGTQLVYVAADSTARQVLEVRALDRTAGTPLPGTANARFPRFSPDGGRVAFLAPPGAVKWMDIEGGTPQTLAEAESFGLCWGDDGYIYFPRPATKSIPAGISRVPERGGQPTVITTIDSTRGEYVHACQQVLTGGGGLLYLNAPAGGMDATELTTYSFATGQSELLLRAPFGLVASTGQLVYITLDHTLTAAPFDDKTLKLTGPPVSLAPNVFANQDFTAFALSAAGTLLYADMEPRLSRLAWVDRAGVATGIGEGRTQEFTSFALSRDGKQIVAAISRDGVSALWVYTLPLGPWTRLFGGVSDADASGGRPAWDPSRERISFMATGANGRSTAWSVAADGQTPAQELRHVTSIPVQDGEYSPDGHWFVFRQGPVGPRQRDILYAWPDPDSAAYPLAVTDADEFAPTISPDGRWLAYVSGEEGQEEIVVQPFPDPGPRTRVSLDGGFEPRWAHSGRELFYRDRAGNLVAAEVRIGANISIGERRVLFSAKRFLNDRNAALYDVAPDDQRFLFIEPVSGGKLRWKLVRGFLSELKAKVGSE